MAWDETRRSFIEKGVLVGGCYLLCPFLARRSAAGSREAEEATYVFDERMSYCCTECTPERCKWLGSDMDFKRKKAAELSEKLGRKISPEEIICSRCRVDDGRAFDAIKACPIRKCVIEKKLLSCGHCRELEQCQRVNPVIRERALAVQRVVLADQR
jgi:hypothetical protein